jgi:hypothetical protein
MIICWGGSSSAKTYSIVQALLLSLLIYDDDCIVFRKTGNTIRHTVYKDFKKIARELKIDKYFNFVDSRFEIVKKDSEKGIWFSGIDDPEKIKGVSTKRVYYNEISSGDPDDLAQIRKRLRGQRGQQILMDFNPIDENHWIKTTIFDNSNFTAIPTFVENGMPKVYSNVEEKFESGRIIANGKEYRGIIVAIKSTHKQNFWVVGSPDGNSYGFIDEQTLIEFEYDRLNNPLYYEVYALGNWGHLSLGGEFYSKFNKHTHVVKGLQVDPNLPIILMFDENVVPYFPCLISQVIEDEDGIKVLRIISEICLKNPDNNITSMTDEIIKRYRVNNLQQVIIGGDATSRKRDVKLQSGENFFTVIAKKLQCMNPVLRLNTSNPPVHIRGQFINEIFSDNQSGLRIEIDSSCINTLNDLIYIKESADSKKVKEKVTDKTTGQTYEKYGHLSDCLDYTVCTLFNLEFQRFMAKGDTVDEKYFSPKDIVAW